MGLGEMMAMHKAKSSMGESWNATKNYFQQWKNGDNANSDQRKEREERSADFERKQAERAERKSKLAEQWAANKAANS